MKIGEELKIEAKDKYNYSSIYVKKHNSDCISIMGESFGESDPYKMVTMSRAQFKRLQAVKL